MTSLPGSSLRAAHSVKRFEFAAPGILVTTQERVRFVSDQSAFTSLGVRLVVVISRLWG